MKLLQIFFLAGFFAYLALAASIGPFRVTAENALEVPRALSGVSQAPQLREPADGQRLSSMAGGARMVWDNPSGANVTQYHIQVIPNNNDGPGVNLIRNVESEYTAQPPVLGQGNYVMLPDMTYTWRVRATDKPTFASEDDLSWGPWAQRTFRTPRPSADAIRAKEPCLGCPATSLTPSLVWANDDPYIFYYEIQVSRDFAFNTDPRTAVAPVYYNLIHAGQSLPLSSWAVPESARLDGGTRYYWRVRPRVQGDGAPVNWPTSFYFDTPAPLDVDLAVSDVSLSSTAVQVGQSLTVEYTIRNQGSASSPPTQSRALLSLDAKISKVDADLGATDAVPTLGPNSSKVRILTVTIPSGTAPGSYYLGVYADYPDSVAETNETNNGAGAPILVQAAPGLLTPTPTATRCPGGDLPPCGTITPTYTPSPTPTYTPTPTIPASTNTAAWIDLTSSQFDQTLFGIAAWDANTVYAVGAGGTILTTTNGGSSWLNRNSGAGTPRLYAVAVADASTAWAVGENGAVRKTTDGGTTWVAQNSGTSEILLGIAAPNANTAWIAANNGKIYSTSDGGNTWVPRNSGTLVALYGAAASSSSVGWIVGDQGKVLKTVDGGVTWQAQNSGTSANLYSVANAGRSNSSTLWAVGISGTIRKTTDGGTNWSAQSSAGVTDRLLSVTAVTSGRAWSVGEGGVIRGTSDGSTWSAQTSPTLQRLNAVAAVASGGSNIIWAVGDFSTILKSTQ